MDYFRKITTDKNCTEQNLKEIETEIMNCVSGIIHDIGNEDYTVNITCKKLGGIPEKCVKGQSIICLSNR